LRLFIKRPHLSAVSVFKERLIDRSALDAPQDSSISRESGL
jgi:hypothetical protein